MLFVKKKYQRNALHFQNAIVMARDIYFIFTFFEMLSDTERSEIEVNFYCANNFVDFK